MFVISSKAGPNILCTKNMEQSFLRLEIMRQLSMFIERVFYKQQKVTFSHKFFFKIYLKKEQKI